LPNTRSLNAWLNTSEISSISSQIQSGREGKNRAMNSSDGYLKSGFKKKLKNGLKRYFQIQNLVELYV